MGRSGHMGSGHMGNADRLGLWPAGLLQLDAIPDALGR